MIITFVCPSAPHPIGGVTAIYEFANGLARRGHNVHLFHAPMWGTRIESLDDLNWFRFEDEVEHHLYGRDPLPKADLIFGRPTRADQGHPVSLIQGFDIFYVELERDAFRRPGLRVCVASWLFDVAWHFGVDPEHCALVSYGIDHRKFRVRSAIEERAKVVGILYNPHPAKGWATGLRALQVARQAVPDLEVLAFGATSPPEALPDWISYTCDPAPRVLVDEIYNQCQVFVQPSHNEGFGFTAVEAMACGAALVTTDNGGSRDYALPGETALVAPPQDASALASHLISLLRDPDRRIRLAHEGRRFVERFSWDQAALDLERCLERYLSDPSPYQRPAGPEAAPLGVGQHPAVLGDLTSG